MPTIDRSSTLLKRMEALEARLARLERPARRKASSLGQDADRYWLLEGLRARVRGRSLGRLAYGGIVLAPGGRRYQWQGLHEVADLFGMEWSEMARAFAALGHRVRLDLVRALIRGVTEVSELQRQAKLKTTGQLYHHLRELQAAGWVRQQERSRYVVVPDRVVAVLLMAGIVAGPEPRSGDTKTRRRKR